ncbi:hypothetical protein LTS18_014137, partial [Coniosporium uncinatum]
EYEDEEEDADVGAEVELSQLSIHGKVHEEDEDPGYEEVEFDSGDFDFLDPRQSKRIRPDRLVPRNQFRDQADMQVDSSPDASYHMPQPGGSSIFPLPPPRQTTRAPRLFGEIGQSALKSSGVLGEQAGQAQHEENRDVSTSANTSIRANGHQPITSNRNSELMEFGPATSLLGTEALVRDMNMESPHSGSSFNEPSTPKTPADHQHSSTLSRGAEGGNAGHPEEVTPKQHNFNRQIRLSMPEPYTYESHHDGEVSNEPLHETIESLPPTIAPTMRAPTEETESRYNQAEQRLSIPPSVRDEFLRPPPRLGALVSTKDSFRRIILRLDEHVTVWGRAPDNTHVYEPGHDTRVAKKAIVIWFHAIGIEKAIKEGRDWTKLESLHTIVNTYSKVGIWVNGVKLRAGGENGSFSFGRIYTGDVITVFQDGGERLKFVCEFHHGEAKERRPTGQPFMITKHKQ